jgi:hypothetical protein
MKNLGNNKHLTVEALMLKSMEYGLDGFSPIFFGFICVDPSYP